MKSIQFFRNELSSLESLIRHITLCSPFRSSETNFVGSSPAIGIFLYVAQSGLRKWTTLIRILYRHISICGPVRFSETNYVASCAAFGIFLYVAQSGLREQTSLVRVPLIGIFLYVAQSGLRKWTSLVRVPLSAYFSMKPSQVFGNEPRWFESRYRHISLCSLVRNSEMNYVGSSPAICIFLYVA
jgi:hypothetical protein